MLTKKANLEDLDKLSPLFNEYRMSLSKESDEIGCRLFLSERITKGESVIILAEMQDRSLAGFVQLYSMYSSATLKKVWKICDLYIKPEHRGKKISKALLEESKILCRFTNTKTLIAEVPAGDLIANELFSGSGFETGPDQVCYKWDVFYSL